MSKKISTYTYALSRPVVDSFICLGEVFEFSNGEIEALFYAIDKVILLIHQEEVEFAEIKYYEGLRPFIRPLNSNYNNLRLSDSRAPKKNAILSYVDLDTSEFKGSNLHIKQKIEDAIKSFKVTQKLLNQDQDENDFQKSNEKNTQKDYQAARFPHFP